MIVFNGNICIVSRKFSNKLENMKIIGDIKKINQSCFWKNYQNLCLLRLKNLGKISKNILQCSSKFLGMMNTNEKLNI